MIKIKNDKGFTLIELLAVIVVLAIILVITVPMVLNTLSSTRQDALQASANSTATFYKEQLALAALGKQESGFVTDATFTNGILVAKSERCITSDEATILGLNNTDYSISTEIASCSKVSWDANGIATVVLKGKSGGKFTNGNTVLEATSGQ